MNSRHTFSNSNTEFQTGFELTKGFGLQRSVSMCVCFHICLDHDVFCIKVHEKNLCMLVFQWKDELYF